MLYIHIPFCKSRCIYCDFYSTTCGSDVQKAYLEALCREMELRRDYLGLDHELSSVYIGGGTPSVLGVESLNNIFSAISRHWSLASDAEVTLEVNPDDVSPDYAQSLTRLPVNRVSMGVQSFNDDMLRFLRRRHTAAQVHSAIRNLLDAGITNLSIDLIYGLPGQTLDDWQSDLDQAFALPISHLSAYALSYEQGTALYRLREQGKVKEADEELSLSQYRMLMERAVVAGFLHYEISNFALPCLQARHNSGYWSGKHYLGLGPAAHSYNGISRQWNNPDLREYIHRFEDGAAANCGSNSEYSEELTPGMRREETILTQLRRAEGIDLSAFSENFGEQEFETLLTRAIPYINNGTLVLNEVACNSFGEPNNQHEREKFLSLTKKGLFVSDDIISSLF